MRTVAVWTIAGRAPATATLVIVAPAPDPEDAAPMAAEQRFLTLADVAEVLNISTSQVYALVRNEQLPAIKIGGRGQWRVERDKLEDYIQRMYAETRQFIAAHPFTEAEAYSDEAAHGGQPGERD
jgi:excisionase family DNA binding protein